MLNAELVEQHDRRSSCWVIISGQVYDVTQYVEQHPGGVNSILRYAGKVSLGLLIKAQMHR